MFVRRCVALCHAGHRNSEALNQPAGQHILIRPPTPKQQQPGVCISALGRSRNVCPLGIQCHLNLRGPAELKVGIWCATLTTDHETFDCELETAVRH